ncbi:cellulose synthase/poly-beta-1,6-N-acetylglucosamine synthase-like glycosyltransferase [Agrococcus sp. UYP10]
MTPIARVLVIVPARDEASTVGACIASIDVARAALAARQPGIETAVVVVADACVDATAMTARAAGAEVVEIEAAAVGEARRAGIQHGLARWPDAEPAATWIAMTDADSTVPARWLLDHVAAAHDGADLHIGRVVPDGSHLPQRVLEAWHAAHDALPAGAAVQGANLGVRADALARVGGVAPMRLHEDVDLVARLRAHGAVLDLRRRAPVRTSDRTRSRVDGGFATYLAVLEGRGQPLID